MTKRHIIAFDAGGTAVKAALYDEEGRECAVAAAAMAPLHPAPGLLERDPEAMWAAICATARKVLRTAAVAPSSIAAVGLTGYGNGLYLVDRNGEPVRNGILSPDQRAQQEVALWREQGLEAGVVALTWHRLWAGKPLPLIAWLDRHEPEALARAFRALLCKDYIRLRLTGVMAVEISDLSSGGLIDHRVEALDCRGSRSFGPEPIRETLRRRTRAPGHRRRGDGKGCCRNRACQPERPCPPAMPTVRRWRSGSAPSTKA